jgi:hypothetical protein
VARPTPLEAPVMKMVLPFRSELVVGSMVA